MTICVSAGRSAWKLENNFENTGMIFSMNTKTAPMAAAKRTQGYTSAETNFLWRLWLASRWCASWFSASGRLPLDSPASIRNPQRFEKTDGWREMASFSVEPALILSRISFSTRWKRPLSVCSVPTSIARRTGTPASRSVAVCAAKKSRSSILIRVRRRIRAAWDGFWNAEPVASMRVTRSSRMWRILIASFSVIASCVP